MKKLVWVAIFLVILLIEIGTAVILYNIVKGSDSIDEYMAKIDNHNRTTELTTEAVSTELPPPSEEEVMFEYCSRLAEKAEGVDEDFAKWLYSYYSDTVIAVLDAFENGSYTERIWYEQTGKSFNVLTDEYNGLLESEAVMADNLIYTKECKNQDYVNLSFAGDVSFADDYAPSQNYTSMGIDGAFSNGVQEAMRDADIFMVNNEFCYTTGGTPVPKGYNFRANPERVKRLDEMGVDIVSIANNHAYDYGAEGFTDTIKTLKDAGVPYVGGGVNLEDAKNHIVYFIANGIKIGYISASQVERDEPIFTKPATEDSPGVVRCFEPDLVNEMIKDAKSHCDFVVVYPHWGTELVKETQEDQRALAHSFIDAGADVVVGGHAHCLQGGEYYNGVPVFYSMSNFSFSSKTVDSVILNLKVTIDGIKEARYIPCLESGGRNHRCEKGDGDYERIIDLFNTYSEKLHVDEDGYVSEN